MGMRFARLGTKIYEKLGISGGSSAFLPALEHALSGGSHAALVTLAHALESSKAEALAELIYSVSPVIGFYKHQTSNPAWKFGTYISRRTLIEQLWRRAVALRATDPEKSTSLARGSLLLAAQDAFQFACAAVERLVNDSLFEVLTAWPSGAIDDVRGLLESERQNSAVFVQQLLSAAADLQFLIDDPATLLNQTRLTSLLKTLGEIIAVSDERTHQHWRVANFCWRIANLARFKSDADAMEKLMSGAREWSNAVANPHFGRWIDEGLSTQSPPPKTVGFRIVTGAELQRLARRQPSVPVSRT